jgi:4-hydroxy-tetrahydrodipicolinate synthase
MAKLIDGVYAAVLTPREADGRLCERSLRTSIEFLLGRGVRGFAFNGATGEYCLTTPAELRRILAVAIEVIANGADFVCGIGSTSVRGCLENGNLAMDAGAKALLLPVPHFFAYEQDDLDVFCREIADKLPAPLLLYHLPQFTNTLELSTVQNLITECPNIVGIKDSSGSLEILRGLNHAGIDTCRIVGNDHILAEALQEGLCDGVISGVAGVLPEMILSLFAQRSRADFGEFALAARHLEEFIEQISRFPVPWGLKLVAESRGMAAATFSQPLSSRRIGQARYLQQWFQNRLSTAWVEA